MASAVNAVDDLSTAIWYFPKIKRVEAEKRLLSTANVHGAFLIRDSESRYNDYSLSVRDGNKIKHYRIRKIDKDGFTITGTIAFRTLHNLVDHYSRNADGLCVNLRLPCAQIRYTELLQTVRDHWEIDHKSLNFIRKLNSGQFGEIWEGIWNKSTPVAIKTLKPGTMDPKDFLVEAEIMKQLRHKNLLPLYAVCTVKEPIYIVTKLMKYGSLLEFLRGKGKNLKYQQMIDIAAQVASGMAYLELLNYVHRDLAARNVLVTDNNIIKIADFGLARIIKGNEYNVRNGDRFPIKWTAPEAAKLGKFTNKSDVWSFGILLTELVTYGRVPYPDLNTSEVLNKVENGYRMTEPPNCTPSLYKIMLECWYTDPVHRPTFEKLEWKFNQFFSKSPNDYEDYAYAK